MEQTIFERYGKIPELDRSFDLKFWQTRSDAEKFAAAWEFVVNSYLIKRRDVGELQLQRSVECFHQEDFNGF